MEKEEKVKMFKYKFYFICFLLIKRNKIISAHSYADVRLMNFLIGQKMDSMTQVIDHSN